MPIRRRLAAAFSGVLLLQLTLFGSGTLCALQREATNGQLGHPAMHVALAEQSRAAVSPADTSVASHQCDSSREGEACRLPWAPGQCASMTACTATAAPAATLLASITPARSAAALLDPGHMESGPPRAPELPPPRA